MFDPKKFSKTEDKIFSTKVLLCEKFLFYGNDSGGSNMLLISYFCTKHGNTLPA